MGPAYAMKSDSRTVCVCTHLCGALLFRAVCQFESPLFPLRQRAPAARIGRGIPEKGPLYFPCWEAAWCTKLLRQVYQMQQVRLHRVLRSAAVFVVPEQLLL